MTYDCSRENCLCNNKEINFLYKTCVVSLFHCYFSSYYGVMSKNKL